MGIDKWATEPKEGKKEKEVRRMAGLIRGAVAGAITIIVLLIWGLGGGPIAGEPSPLIGVEQQITPGEIYFQGSGEPDTATVTLTLKALRSEPFPLDLVLVVDRSASSDVTVVREIGREILERLGREDRVALVSFADTATLDVALTRDEGLAAAQLDRMENMGKTAMGEGLALATSELIENGREDAVLVEILLIDGRSNTGRDPLPQAESAARGGITIFVIGTSEYLQVDLLTEIATITGGLFFPRFDGEVLDRIFSALYRDLVGSEVTITRTLAEGFDYKRALLNPPRVVRHNGLTTLEWSLEGLAVGGHWSTSFEISYVPPVSGRKTMEVDREPGTVSFIDFRHQWRSLEIPALAITVRAPNRPPLADFGFTPERPTDLDTIRFDDRSSDPDGEIVAWHWDFGDGTTSMEQNPAHRYSDDGRYRVKLTVRDNEGAEAGKALEIAVLNVSPVAGFTYSPAEPGIGQRVEFDASGSHDPDGEIVKYEWDLDGDGMIETEGLTTAKVYEQAGTYRVTLQVTDDDGATATSTQEVEVFEPTAVTRTINTYLHVDKTLPGQTFRVTVTIEVNMDLFGLGLDENLPPGWTVTPVENAEATYHQGAVQWLFVRKIPAGSVKRIVYDVTVPEDAALKIYDINGNISSASPNFEMAVGGENQVEITDRLPISWVISRWDTENDQFDIDIQNRDKITFDQIQQAVAWWLEGKIVPHTGGAVIDLKTMEELVAYWLTDTPVYEPLP